MSDIYHDDGAGGDFGYAQNWSNSDMSALTTPVVKYKGGRSWRDYNDLEILNGARILGQSPDNPGHLRLSYNTGLHGEFLADLENWDDPAQKTGFCNGVRGYVKEATKKTKPLHGMTREQLSDRNKQLNEQQHWSTDSMALLGPNGLPYQQQSAPLQLQQQQVPTHADPVVALQQQLGEKHGQLTTTIAQYQEAINTLSVELATVEQQYNAISAAAQVGQPIAVPTAPQPLTPLPPPVAHIEPIQQRLDIGDIGPEDAQSVALQPVHTQVTSLPEGL